MKFWFWASTSAAAAFLSSDTLRVFEVENHCFFNPWSTQVNLFILGLFGIKNSNNSKQLKKKKAKPQTTPNKWQRGNGGKLTIRRGLFH